MSKKKKPVPIPFEDKEAIRKTLGWHIDQIMNLYDQLKPHKTPRGIIAGTSKNGEVGFLIFRGVVEDLFKVKEFLDGLGVIQEAGEV
jgi:hypothetical protein